MTCEDCGNPAPADAWQCPACGSYRLKESGKGRRVEATIDVGHDALGVEERVARVEREIERQKKRGVKFLVVVTGYGSSGIGGATKEAVLARIRAMASRGTVRAVLADGQLSPATNAGRQARGRYPELARTRVWDSGNEGAVVVVLR